MEQSILKSTKKVLGLADDYTAFDPDVITFINSALSTLNDLGVGPDGGLYIEDATTEWSALTLPDNELHMVKSYIYLKVRMLFDPPGTSFLIEAMDNQIAQFEWRLNVIRENILIEQEELEEEVI